MSYGIVIPANFAGTMVYDSTLPTSPAVFTLNLISGGVTTVLGTITLTTASHTNATLSIQPEVNLEPGDVLQLVAPTAQDSTLANIGITVFANKASSNSNFSSDFNQDFA